MSTAIKFENISKQYRLGLVSTNTISHDLKRWWVTNVRGKEDPYLKIGDVNDRATKGTSDYVWALKDINFDVKQGDVLGIIGKNGAGKSTLLKILSKVTAPTTGTIKAAGRIASLLEVGTGFHPEMTGRENIYMNGAIMGMTKAEINRKLDEIVDFSGCERYIDTPAKRYSSGMTVRLGFAIAAHLDPEILVVDEVLAVGDAEFQKKAIGKMQDVSRGEGRTVLFVSHNMASMRQLCNNGLLLKNGCIQTTGTMKDVIDSYLGNASVIDNAHWRISEIPRNTLFSFTEIQIIDKNGNISEHIGSEEDFLIKVTLNSQIKMTNSIIAVQFSDTNDYPVMTTSSCDFNKQIEIIEPGISTYIIEISKNILMPGSYSIEFACFESRKILYDIVENKIKIKIEDFGTKLFNMDSKGSVCPLYKWSKI